MLPQVHLKRFRHNMKGRVKENRLVTFPHGDEARRGEADRNMTKWQGR